MAALDIDLDADVVGLTLQLVDVPSESGSEGPLADAVERVLREESHLTVERAGNCVVARTQLGRPERVLLGGHLDTVPAAGNIPGRRAGGYVHGLGSVDMKGGVAVALTIAHGMREPNRDVTYVFYDCEEIEASRNGLGHLARDHPAWLEADFAILLEPSGSIVEAGCQGTLRARITVTGRRAHSARPWLGDNAIHAAGQVLDRLRAYQPRTVLVDGLQYREGLSAVGIEGGVAGNVIPDSCTVTVNYRFAPSRSTAQAEAHIRELFTGYDVTVVDLAPGALPGLGLPAAKAFVEAVGGTPRPKFGWTDVARFAELGVPAVNFGPGDPSLAHAVDERVPEEQLVTCERGLRSWLAA